MNPLTVGDVLWAKNLIGGELQIIKDRIIYCGPLIEIKEDRGIICFTVEWCAVNKGNGWSACNSDSFCIVKDAFKPWEDENGKISFSIPYMGRATIYPLGSHTLDPQYVSGIESNKSVSALKLKQRQLHA